MSYPILAKICKRYLSTYIVKNGDLKSYYTLGPSFLRYFRATGRKSKLNNYGRNNLQGTNNIVSCRPMQEYKKTWRQQPHSQDQSLYVDSETIRYTVKFFGRRKKTEKNARKF